jgi:biopolymer transport protein ExbB
MVLSSPARRLARQSLLLLVLGLLITAGVAPGSAKAWWQKDWPYRKQIVIDTTAKGLPLPGPVGRAPLLIRLHSGNFKFDDSLESGADLRFVAGDDKTPLNFQVESFDALLGVATIWVDVPQVPAGSAKTIWMYYGNKKASPPGPASAIFDPDYVAVYHFAPGGAPPKDVTAYGNNAQTAPSASDEASVIAAGARFTGAAPMLIPGGPSLAVAAGAPRR